MHQSRAGDEQAHEVERVFREGYGQAVATLVRVFGDITLAEDAVQDSFVTATARWPTEGIPPNPAGWIVTTARNRAIDYLRRRTRGEQLQQLLEVDPREPDRPDDERPEDGPVSDDRLRLIFTCCHPALRTESQVGLTLRLLGGLSVEEVARSFLVSEAAMSKRLVRAKHKIKAGKIPYRVPAAADLPSRLRSVLLVVYLIYNAGLEDLARAELRREAIRLARLLVELMPDEPEAHGLLALILLTEARVPARTAANGSLVLLADQDRRLWDRALIGEGQQIVRRCLPRNRPGPYQLQAAINAVHSHAESMDETDWAQIVTLYNQLMAITPTPVVALNRAIAVGEMHGPAAALALVEPLDLDGYYAFHATRADLLSRLGRKEQAAAEYERAADLAPMEADREFLRAGGRSTR